MVKKTILIISLLVLSFLVSCTLTPLKDGVEQESILSASSEFEAMNTALLDEYKAHATYEQIIVDFGDVRPFSNVINAEQVHINALERLYPTKGYELPSIDLAEIPHFDTLEEACQAGVQAEIDNAAIYDELFKLDLPADTKTVFENLQRASLEKHLPAFKRCS